MPISNRRFSDTLGLNKQSNEDYPNGDLTPVNAGLAGKVANRKVTPLRKVRDKSGAKGHTYQEAGVSDVLNNSMDNFTAHKKPNLISPHNSMTPVIKLQKD